MGAINSLFAPSSASTFAAATAYNATIYIAIAVVATFFGSWVNLIKKNQPLFQLFDLNFLLLVSKPKKSNQSLQDLQFFLSMNHR